MRKLFITLIILSFFSSLKAQETNKKVWDDKLNKEILTGKCNRNAFTEGDFSKYFNKEYGTYKPDKKHIKKIKKKIDEVEIVLVFGEWCGDSKREVPRFMKILDQTNYDDKNLKIYAVNRSKNAGNTNLSKYNIKRIPTFIIYKNGIEIGRIIETPNESLEKDLLEILKNAN
jgi:thiol-disulfide isomerase/thioredoxin